MSKYNSRCFWFSEQSMGNPGTVPVCGMFDTVESFSCENCKAYIGRATARDLIKRKVKPVTNADRVRAMSDEELARWLTGGVKSVLARCPGCELSTTFEQEALEWLKQEATDAQ